MLKFKEWLNEVSASTAKAQPRGTHSHILKAIHDFHSKRNTPVDFIIADEAKNALDAHTKDPSKTSARERSDAIEHYRMIKDKEI